MTPEWLEVVSLGQPPASLLGAYLDEGEAAVIALAIEFALHEAGEL